MKRRSILRSLAVSALLGVLLGSFLPNTAAAAEKWGPFRGQIVDVETGEPIAGVAVLVAWYEMIPNPVHTTRRFYDALEAVSDKDGRFEVPRRSPPFFDFRIFPPDIMIFVPGYVEQSESVTPPNGQPFVDPTEIRMRRLKTRQELREKSRSRPSSVPDEKMPGLIRVINIERKMLGLGQIGPTRETRP